MKKNILIIIAILIALSIFSQDKVINIPLERNVELMETIDLGDNGIIFKTGKVYPNSKKLDWKLRYYSSTLELIWEAPIEKTQIYKGFLDPIVASPTGNFVYQVEFKGYNTTMGASNVYLTQINREGKTKSKEFGNNIFKNRLEVFCDDKYLYFLCTEGGKENSDKKKAYEKIILNRIDNSNFAYKRIIVETPDIEDPEHSIFWRYFGHDGEKIYLFKKIVRMDEGECIYNVITINSDGKVIDNITLNAKVAGKFPRPAFHTKSFKGHDLGDYFQDFKLGAQGVMHPKTGAYSNIELDKRNNVLYIYGLYGDKPFKGIAPKYEGYFIRKYNMKGEEFFSVIKDAPQALAANSFFRYKGSPDSRNLTLTINQDNSVNFYIWFQKNLYATVFSEDGQLSDSFLKEYDDWVNLVTIYTTFPPSSKNKSTAYINSIDPKIEKNTTYKYFGSTTGEIIIEYRDKEDEIKLLYFEKP